MLCGIGDAVLATFSFSAATSTYLQAPHRVGSSSILHDARPGTSPSKIGRTLVEVRLYRPLPVHNSSPLPQKTETRGGEDIALANSFQSCRGYPSSKTTYPWTLMDSRRLARHPACQLAALDDNNTHHRDSSTAAKYFTSTFMQPREPALLRTLAAPEIAGKPQTVNEAGMDMCVVNLTFFQGAQTACLSICVASKSTTNHFPSARVRLSLRYLGATRHFHSTICATSSATGVAAFAAQRCKER